MAWFIKCIHRVWSSALHKACYESWYWLLAARGRIVSLVICLRHGYYGSQRGKALMPFKRGVASGCSGFRGLRTGHLRTAKIPIPYTTALK